MGNTSNIFASVSENFNVRTGFPKLCSPSLLAKCENSPQTCSRQPLYHARSSQIQLNPVNAQTLNPQVQSNRMNFKAVLPLNDINGLLLPEPRNNESRPMHCARPSTYEVPRCVPRLFCTTRVAFVYFISRTTRYPHR